MRISLVIPAKNEARNLERMREPLQKLCELCPIELILVDDGSTDDTLKVMENISHSTIIHHPTSLGKTESLREAFNLAGGEVLAFIDGDFQINPLNLHRLLPLIEYYDLVTGWRIRRREGGEPVGKIIQSAVYNCIVRLATGSTLHDHNCPLKIFRRELLPHMDLSREGYIRWMIVMVQRKGFRTAEVPVRWHTRQYGTSKFFGPRRLFSGLKQLIVLKLRGKI